MATAADYQQRADRIFSLATVRRLAEKSSFPADADLEFLAIFLRDSAFFYFEDDADGSIKDRHDEIAALSSAAEGREYQALAVLLKDISPINRMQIEQRAEHRGMAFPNEVDLRDLNRRDEACDTVAALVRLGGRYKVGRRRLTGKRSRTWHTDLLSVPSPRNFPKRENERVFVERLQASWRLVAKSEPAPTASRQRKGPFVRFVQECLDLVGARQASAVDIINAIAATRKIALSCIKTEPTAG